MEWLRSMRNYVPQWAVDIIKVLQEQGKKKTAINNHFKRHYPDISDRTIQRWSSCYLSDNYRTRTVKGHFFHVPSKSIVPSQFSQVPEFIERRQEMIDRAIAEKRFLRIVNSQDDHVNNTDPGLIELRNQIVMEYQPDCFPALMDAIDNKLISPHEKTFYQASYENPKEGEWERGGIEVLLTITDDMLSGLRDVVPDHCLIYQGSSNHFDWVLKSLHKAPEFASYFFRDYFKTLKNHDTLWIEADRHEIVQLTNKLLFFHGKLSRKNYGSTAKAYLTKFENQYSVAAGHSHRMETVWTRPTYAKQERFFANVSGTLGNIHPDWTRHDYLGHGWGFSLLNVPPSGMKGASVEEVPIWVEGKYYVAYWRGKRYTSLKTREWEWEKLLYLA